MKTSDIIKAVYNYYPKLVENTILATESKEYSSRVKKCEEARLNQNQWLNFKNELTAYVKSNFNDELADYSNLGSVPCYSASIGFGDHGSKNSWMLSVLISVITPLWSYRIIDFDAPNTVRYDAVYSHEIYTIQYLDSLIKKYFPDFEFIGQEQGQVAISDIATAFKTSPTIFEAIFKDDLN